MNNPHYLQVSLDQKVRLCRTMILHYSFHHIMSQLINKAILVSKATWEDIPECLQLQRNCMKEVHELSWR